MNKLKKDWGRKVWIIFRHSEDLLMALEKSYEGINKEPPNFMLLQILRFCNSTIIKQTGLVKSCKTINLQRDLDELLYCLYQMTLDFLGIFHQNYLFFLLVTLAKKGISIRPTLPFPSLCPQVRSLCLHLFPAKWGDICMHIADSFHCRAETKTIL